MKNKMLKLYLIIIFVLVAFVTGYAVWCGYHIQDVRAQELEEVANARFVEYSKEGMKAVDYDLIIDKDTGVQYLVTDDGVTVLMNPDGTPVVTTE